MVAFAAITRRAVDDGDVVEHHEPEDIARLLVSMYLGLRATSDLAEPDRFLHDLERAWGLILPGIAKPDRIDFTQFVKRRTTVAIEKKATPLGSE